MGKARRSASTRVRRQRVLMAACKVSPIYCRVEAMPSVPMGNVVEFSKSRLSFWSTRQCLNHIITNRHCSTLHNTVHNMNHALCSAAALDSAELCTSFQLRCSRHHLNLKKANAIKASYDQPEVGTQSRIVVGFFSPVLCTHVERMRGCESAHNHKHSAPVLASEGGTQAFI